MRGLSAWSAALAALVVGMLVVSAAAINPAAPAPSANPAANPNLRAEALTFAADVQRIFAITQQKYVRPVARADLAEAVVAGLYEAIHEPMPANLKIEIRQADAGELFALLTRVREGLGNHEALRGQRALLVCLQALPRALDPYCGLTTPQDDYDGNSTGTGLEFPIAAAPPVLRSSNPEALLLEERNRTATNRPVPTGPVRIVGVLPGSPAQRAGLRPGDLIVKIDGHPPEHPAFAVLFRRLLPVPLGAQFDTETKGPATRLTVLRTGQAQALEVGVTPAVFRPESVFGTTRRPDGTWDHVLDRAERLGYIRVGAIGVQSHFDLQAALKALQSNSVRGLILDLRWCPGGYLQPAATIAHLFLAPDLPIATQRERNVESEPVPFDATEVTFTEVPIVVLINGDTSGGGELIAAALQDHRRATIAGQRSVGKGSIQRTPTEYNAPFKLTVGTYGRPSGKNLQRFPDSKWTDDWGIRPDAGRELPVTADLGRQLKEWYVRQALRPAASREALPLDDPESDPQRLAAAQMLRELLAKP